MTAKTSDEGLPDNELVRIENGQPIITCPPRETESGSVCDLESRLAEATVDFSLTGGCGEIAARTAGYSGRDLVTLIGNVQQRAVMRLLQHQADEIVLAIEDFRDELGLTSDQGRVSGR